MRRRLTSAAGLRGVVALVLVGAAVATAGPAAAGSAPAPASTHHQARPAAPLDPPMGWSSWSSLRDNVSASTIEAQANAMRQSLAPYGYRYVNVDAGWNSGVDAYGRVTYNTTRFPDGIAAVARYVHSLGLKFGIYLVPGIPAAALTADSPILGTPYHVDDIADTSQPGNTADDGSARIDFSEPGAAAYVQSQADLLASWGVDYIKMDFVGPGGGRVPADNTADIEQWHRAIADTGRQMHLELSNSLSIADANIWENYSNGWRIEGDIECYHSCTALTYWKNVAKRFTDAPAWVGYAGPGHWNDLDSLEVGNGDADGITSESRSFQ